MVKCNKRVNELRSTPGMQFWQRNYYEHIIRSEAALYAIRRYIQNNPLQWELDRDNCQNIRYLSPPAQAQDYLSDLPSARIEQERY